VGTLSIKKPGATNADLTEAGKLPDLICRSAGKRQERLAIIKFSFAAVSLATVITVGAARAELSDWSPVSINGIGGIKVGMTPQQASNETALKMDTESPGGAGCYYIVPTRNYLHGISFMVTGDNTAIDYSSDRIARVDITNSDVRTKSGVSIGDTESDVRRIYLGRITAGKEYNQRTLIYTPAEAKDQNFRVVFLMNRGKVQSYRAGKTPEVLYIEGCL
jgi:hypothetical protein